MFDCNPANMLEGDPGRSLERQRAVKSREELKARAEIERCRRRIRSSPLHENRPYPVNSDRARNRLHVKKRERCPMRAQRRPI